MNLILTHETFGRQHRLVAACFQHGWRSMQYNPALDREANHLAIASKLADVLGVTVGLGHYGKVSEAGGMFHDMPVDPPPVGRKFAHRHSDGVAYYHVNADGKHVVQLYYGADYHWTFDFGTAEAASAYVTQFFAERQAELAQAKIADLQERIANAPAFIPMDTDGLADEPEDTDDTSAIEPATGRQDAPVVLVTETPVNAVLSDPVAAMPLRISTSRKLGAVITLRPKALNGAAFFELAQAAKNAARGALGDYWYLKPGQSLHLDIPARYRSFRTAIGTKIKLSGDRRYPAAEYWPTGQFPALVSPIADYAWDTSTLEPEPYRGSGASGHGKPEPLMLFPEIEIEDDRDESEPDDLREAA